MIKDKIKKGDYVKFNKRYIQKLIADKKELKYNGIITAIEHIKNGNKLLKVKSIANNHIILNADELNLPYYFRNLIRYYGFIRIFRVTEEEVIKVNK